VLGEVKGRNVIVLKQRTPSIARWLFDSCTKSACQAQSPEKEDLGIVESEEGALDDDEQVASCFAGDILLGGRAEDWLNNASPQPKETGTPKISRANYRRKRKGQYWQDSPINMHSVYRCKTRIVGSGQQSQETGQDPWRIARDIALKGQARAYQRARSWIVA